MIVVGVVEGGGNFLIFTIYRLDFPLYGLEIISLKVLGHFLEGFGSFP
jgi:hypothetical protein